MSADLAIVWHGFLMSATTEDRGLWLLARHSEVLDVMRVLLPRDFAASHPLSPCPLHTPARVDS